MEKYLECCAAGYNFAGSGLTAENDVEKRDYVRKHKEKGGVIIKIQQTKKG